MKRNNRTRRDNLIQTVYYLYPFEHIYKLE